MRGRWFVGVVGSVAMAGPIGAAIAALGATAPYAFGIGAGLAVAAAVLVARRLPARVDELARSYPRAAIVWLLVALLGAANFARVSYFMIDANATQCSLAPSDDFMRTHNCLTAYYRAAVAQRAGVANVYDPVVYEGRDEDPDSVRMIGPFPIDLYEYPPPFLVPVRAVLAVSDDFMVWRAAWFSIEALLLGATVLLLAAWIGGREGLYAALLAPAVLFAAPVVLLLQVGNYQVAVYALTILGLLAIERGRDAVGGTLLAITTVTKVFPGLFLVYLVARGRYRAAVMMLGASVAVVLLAAAVVGLGPFRAFVSYQLPRMADGSAFPWLQDYVPAIAANHSIFGIVLKLRVLGVPGMTFSVAAAVAWVFTLVAAAITFVLGRAGARDRGSEALVWLGLLQLAALRSPFTPDVYAVFGPIWITTLLVARTGHNGRALGAFAWLALSAGVIGLSVTRPMGDNVRFALTGAVQAIGFATTYVALRPPRLAPTKH
jgi:hypothetical protein